MTKRTHSYFFALAAFSLTACDSPSGFEEPPAEALLIEAAQLQKLSDDLAHCRNTLSVPCTVAVEVRAGATAVSFNLHTISSDENYHRSADANSPYFLVGASEDHDRLNLTLYPGEKGAVQYIGYAMLTGASHYFDNFSYEENAAGASMREQMLQGAPTLGDDALFPPPTIPSQETLSRTLPTAASTAPRILELATDADYEMYERWESEQQIPVNDFILGLIHSANGFLELHADLQVRVVHQHVWRQATDPYDRDELTSLANQFATHHDFGSFDAKILFTARELDDDRLGVAYIGSACRRDKYNVGVIDARTNSSLTATTTTHEIAHLVGAVHVNGSDCTGSDRPLMCTHLTEGRHTHVASSSLSAIDDYLATVSCLSDRPAERAIPQTCQSVTINAEAFQGNWAVRDIEIEEQSIRDAYHKDAPSSELDTDEATFFGCTVYRALSGIWSSATGADVDGALDGYACEDGSRYQRSTKRIFRSGIDLGNESLMLLGQRNRIRALVHRLERPDGTRYASTEWSDHDLDGQYDVLWEGHFQVKNSAYECSTIGERMMYFRRLPSGDVLMQGHYQQPIECRLAHFRTEVSCQP